MPFSGQIVLGPLISFDKVPESGSFNGDEAADLGVVWANRTDLRADHRKFPARDGRKSLLGTARAVRVYRDCAATDFEWPGFRADRHPCVNDPIGPLEHAGGHASD